MSGHSKWHNIQVRKGKADKLRGSLFTKLAKSITVAASNGGDIETNFSLRLAIEKAKEVNVPKDNIERAIRRGTGELSDGLVLEEVMYEGFGPGGSAFLVEAVTDNKTRTVSEIKNVFNKYGGSMGGPGSVKWQFNHLGVARIGVEELVKIKDKKSEFELDLIDAGASDIIDFGYGIEIQCEIDKLQSVLEIIKKYQLQAEDTGLEWVARKKIKLIEDDKSKVEKLYDILNNLDDVESVFVNVISNP